MSECRNVRQSGEDVKTHRLMKQSVCSVRRGDRTRMHYDSCSWRAVLRHAIARQIVLEMLLLDRTSERAVVMLLNWYKVRALRLMLRAHELLA